MNSTLLLIDGIINLLLGIPLMAAPNMVAGMLGLPQPASWFYPGILGAVLTGIGFALLIQVWPGKSPISGLGLEGAVYINLLGAGALACWLLFGDLDIPLRGRLFLWAVALIVLSLSIIEIRSRFGGKTLFPLRTSNPGPEPCLLPPSSS